VFNFLLAIDLAFWSGKLTLRYQDQFFEPLLHQDIAPPVGWISYMPGGSAILGKLGSQLLVPHWLIGLMERVTPLGPNFGRAGGKAPSLYLNIPTFPEAGLLLGLSAQTGRDPGGE